LVVKIVRIKRADLPKSIKIAISSATYDSGKITYTFSKPHKLLKGNSINIMGSIPSEFNQTNATVTNVINENKFQIDKTVTSTYISGGYIEIPINSSLDQYYLIKYRIVNDQNETSQWSPLFAVKNTYEEDVPFIYLDGGEG
jgi:hypothetical protein